ncbi:MAG: UDP-2,4-diacetamido-2,4,6-trideoxy-beta-L-altropyranose hydrolase [Nitrospirota bacterium]|nr:UDP-2,4-diacetamido-2,4,6-trideoxy-beta-L-altropyranose hydrolase [Nitrospirota bacterium]
MGIGHLMRCLTLAETLRSRGVETRFICRAHLGNMVELLERQAMPVTVLPAPAQSPNVNSEDYASWLGVTQDEDAEQTIEALFGDRPDWLVVDHYGLDADWEQRLRPHTVKLMVIDDLADRRHDCDLLLNQNYSEGGENRYRDLVPESCRLLLGPRYALLRPDYVAYRRTLRPRDGMVRRVLVFLGGSDPHNMTGLALEGLSAPEFQHLEVDVVVGANNSHRVALEKQVSARPLTNLYGSRSHLADLMAYADLAIGAGGGTTWERMCLGLPSLVVSIADNQRPACEALDRAELIQYIGSFRDVRSTDLVEVLKRSIGNRERLLARSTQNQLLVDGLGALRLAEALHQTPADELRLRPACPDEVGLYFNWANEPEVRRQAIHSEPISWKSHQEWFSNKFTDSQSRPFVLLAGALPVGQIRFDRQGEEAQIDYSLDALVRARGWETQLVAMGTALFHQSEPMRIRVEGKDENPSSHGIFVRLGFAHAESKGKPCFSIAILSDRTSWLNDYISELVLDWLSAGHRVLWVHDKHDLRPGDFCFYLSCGQIVPVSILSQYRHNLVVHESDLPKGKGWSPLSWQILEGRNKISVTLFEAAKKVDSGRIYAQESLEFEGHELIEELRVAQARATRNLCKRFVSEYPAILAKAREQVGEESLYPRRKLADSKLNASQSIVDQFALLRIVDNERYPAFFENDGYEYVIAIRKIRQH